MTTLETLNIETINDFAFETYNTNADQIARGDSGYDLYYCGPTVHLAPFQEVLLGLGVKGELVGSNIHGYELWPRSSIRKTPLQLSNSIGLIDHGYRGEIMATVRNVSMNTFTIIKGAKLFQLCMPDKRPFHVDIVDDLSDTVRGSGGFGSTDLPMPPTVKASRQSSVAEPLQQANIIPEVANAIPEVDNNA